LRNLVLILGALVTSTIVLIAMVAVPFWVSRGTFGKTFLDKPGFSIVAVNLSKYGTDCYIRTTVSNTGNIYIAKLTMSLNGTYVFSDGWIPPNGLSDSWQRFQNYGYFHCADTGVGQTYSASFLSEFADGVNQSASKMLEVGPYPLPPPP
jgi:hypothetical protein